MSIKQVEKFTAEVEIPEGVTVSLKKNMLQVKGPLGKTFKSFRKIPVKIQVEEKKVILNAMGTRKKDHAILNTARSIIRNLCEGITQGYTIKMRIVYAHFPVTVKVEKNIVIIENFQGERAPRTAKIVKDTKVVPKGDVVTLTGPVLTDVTQTAANIEQHTKVKNKDHRVFLDGIYIETETKGIEK